MPDLYPDAPRDADGQLDAAAFAAMPQEELDAFLEQSLDVTARLRDHDSELIGDLTQPQVIEIMRAGVNACIAAQAEKASRETQTAEFSAELGTLAAQVIPEPTEDPAPDPSLSVEDDPPADPDPAPEDPPVPVEVAPAEPIVAAAPAPTFRRPLPAAGRHAPVPLPQESGMVLTASAGLESVGEGRPLDPRDGANSLNVALVEKIRRSVSTPQGFRETVVVARGDIKSQVPEFRRLHSDQDSTNAEKIETLVASAKRNGVGSGEYGFAEAEALTASGGICAPVTPYYQLAFISTMERPVRDSLVGFIADRGGINYAPPPYLSQITTGVGVITAAQDAAGGSTGTKTCQTLICPSFVVADVEAIFHCFTGGNLGQRAFPEQASQFSSLILAQHARVAETELLNHIKAGSTAVTGLTNAGGLGAISSLLDDILTAAAAYRSNNRMSDDAPLQVILPAWTGDLLLIDLIKSQFQRFAMNQAGLEALFATFNIRVTYTLDGPSDGAGQVLARQGAGAMNPLPTTVEWALFHPGAWLFVDSGVLELGIVRDSVLNAENSYQVFGESWETAAGIGVQSLWVTSTVCGNGTTSGPVDNHANCA